MFDRHFYRIDFVTKAKVEMFNESFDAVTENLSLDGLFLHTDHPLPVGKMATINLNIPSTSHTFVTVKGEVVRNSPGGAAFHFKAVDYETFSELKTVVVNKLPSHDGNSGFSY